MVHVASLCLGIGLCYSGIIYLQTHSTLYIHVYGKHVTHAKILQGAGAVVDQDGQPRRLYFGIGERNQLSHCSGRNVDSHGSRLAWMFALRMMVYRHSGQYVGRVACVAHWTRYLCSFGAFRLDVDGAVPADSMRTRQRSPLVLIVLRCVCATFWTFTVH